MKLCTAIAAFFVLVPVWVNAMSMAYEFSGNVNLNDPYGIVSNFEETSSVHGTLVYSSSFADDWLSYDVRIFFDDFFVNGEAWIWGDDIWSRDDSDIWFDFPRQYYGSPYPTNDVWVGWTGWMGSQGDDFVFYYDYTNYQFYDEYKYIQYTGTIHSLRAVPEPNTGYLLLFGILAVVRFHRSRSTAGGTA